MGRKKSAYRNFPRVFGSIAAETTYCLLNEIEEIDVLADYTIYTYT